MSVRELYLEQHARVCLASVAVDDVRDVVNVSSAEVPDAKVLKMIKRAEVTLEF